MYVPLGVTASDSQNTLAQSAQKGKEFKAISFRMEKEREIVPQKLTWAASCLALFLLSSFPTLAQRAEKEARAVGSPYVELDSWIYPAIERLAALGRIHTEFLGMRPWTRLECARLVQEAEDGIDAGGSGSDQMEGLQ